MRPTSLALPLSLSDTYMPGTKRWQILRPCPLVRKVRSTAWLTTLSPIFSKRRDRDESEANVINAGTTICSSWIWASRGWCSLHILWWWFCQGSWSLSYKYFTICSFPTVFDQQAHSRSSLEYSARLGGKLQPQVLTSMHYFVKAAWNLFQHIFRLLRQRLSPLPFLIQILILRYLF